jgi:hypothetical protein
MREKMKTELDIQTRRYCLEYRLQKAVDEGYTACNLHINDVLPCSFCDNWNEKLWKEAMKNIKGFTIKFNSLSGWFTWRLKK